MILRSLTAVLLFVMHYGSLSAAPRDIQFSSVDLDAEVLELTNFGSAAEPLDGYRFCSHDASVVRRYSSGSGLNGQSIAPGASLFVHFLNDAPAGDPAHVNISALGNFATPLSRTYAIQIYFPPLSFGNGNTIADHLQWSIDGIDNTSADERSDEAESGGVWTDQSLWIATTATSSLIVLTDTSGGVLHSPADYVVDPAVAEPMSFEVNTVELDGSGNVVMTWPFEAGVEYEVQRSIDLETFAPIGTTTVATFTDTAPPAGGAFYRIVASFP